jgi:hypothetical protein
MDSPRYVWNGIYWLIDEDSGRFACMLFSKNRPQDIGEEIIMRMSLTTGEREGLDVHPPSAYNSKSVFKTRITTILEVESTVDHQEETRKQQL